jgi:hypothetical protein
MDSNPKPERLIVKPPGAAGKRNGYQVREAMGLGDDKQQYNALMVNICTRKIQMSLTDTQTRGCYKTMLPAVSGDRQDPSWAG